MANKQHIAVLKEGVEAWNEWRQKNLLVTPDLSGTDVYLSEIDLSKADLSNANLSEANLSKANLSNSDLRGAYLMGTNLINTNLYAADLTNADLRGAYLIGAYLRGASLISTEAVNANFKGATLTEAHIKDWNIDNQTNLNDVICDYIYLETHRQERYPETGRLAPGEFTDLYLKSIEGIELIFTKEVNWKAFAYSMKKTKVINKSTKITIQSIENKRNGAIIVKLGIIPYSDRNKIRNYFWQSYKLSSKAFKIIYQDRIEDKNQPINHLFELLSQSQEKLQPAGLF